MRTRATAMAAALIFGAITAGAETIDDIIGLIELNNLSLRESASTMAADIDDLKSENRPGATSIEFNPFFNRGGISSSEFIVKQDFDFPTAYSARSSAGKARREEMKISADEIRRQTALEARKKCLELCMTREANALLDRRIALNEMLQKASDEKLKLNESTGIERNMTLLDAMELKAERAGNLATIARIERELTAMNGGLPLPLDKLELPEGITTSPDEGTLNSLVDGSSQVRSAEASAAASEKDVAVAKNSWAPGLSLGYRMETEGKSATHGMMIGIGFDLFTASDKVKAARNRETAARLKVENSRIAERAEQESLIAEMEATRSLMAVYDINLLDKTQEMLDTAFKDGSMTVDDYCEGTDKILSQKSEYSRLRYQLMTLSADLYK